jgi:hypothetical protein
MTDYFTHLAHRAQATPRPSDAHPLPRTPFAPSEAPQVPKASPAPESQVRTPDASREAAPLVRSSDASPAPESPIRTPDASTAPLPDPHVSSWGPATLRDFLFVPQAARKKALPPHFRAGDWRRSPPRSVLNEGTPQWTQVGSDASSESEAVISRSDASSETEAVIPRSDASSESEAVISRSDASSEAETPVTEPTKTASEKDPVGMGPTGELFFGSPATRQKSLAGKGGPVPSVPHNGTRSCKRGNDRQRVTQDPKRSLFDVRRVTQDPKRSLFDVRRVTHDPKRVITTRFDFP